MPRADGNDKDRADGPFNKKGAPSGAKNEHMKPESVSAKKGVKRSAEASRRALTPLWVVSIFVSLTETVLGVGVIRTSGGIQVALTVFVIAFAVLVASGFFLILWFRPYVLSSYGIRTG